MEDYAAQQFRTGDIVSYRTQEGCTSVGIVFAVSDGGLRINIYDHGFPRGENVKIDADVKKASMEEFADYLTSILPKFKFDSGGLNEAIEASKHYFLDKFIEAVRSGEDTKKVLRFLDVDSLTGVYVTVGKYIRSDRKSVYSDPEAIETYPRLSIPTLIKLLKDLYPEGFGSIKGVFVDMPLITYRIYEIPEYGLHLVRDRKRIVVTADF